MVWAIETTSMPRTSNDPSKRGRGESARRNSVLAQLVAILATTESAEHRVDKEGRNASHGSVSDAGRKS